jgi:hypothetical protein
MKLLELCLETAYFQVDDRYYQQKEGMAMGSLLSPVFSNIFVEHFEKLALDTAEHTPALWLRYIEDTFVVWSGGLASLQESFNHSNSLRPTIKFTLEIEIDSAVPFLDALLSREDPR